MRRDWYCEDVLSGKMDVDVVWEDERVLAFNYPQPMAEVHVVVIPKYHVPSILDEVALDGALLTLMVRAVQETAHALGLDEEGFYVRTNAAHALAYKGAGDSVEVVDGTSKLDPAFAVSS